MKFKNRSIFNLIEIFTNSKKVPVHTISPKTHCDQEHIHDYYCDAERPFVSYN